MSVKLMIGLLWDPLPDTIPTFGWWRFPPLRDPATAVADTASDPEQAKVDRRVHRDAVQALVRKAYLATVAEQHTEHRPPGLFAQAWRARLVGLLAQATADPTVGPHAKLTGSDLDLAWRLYELASRARLHAIESATATHSHPVQRGKQVPTFEFSITSGGEPLAMLSTGYAGPAARACCTRLSSLLTGRPADSGAWR
jgi:hypothetical protein